MKTVNAGILTALLLTACAHQQERTKYSDKNLRVMLDPDSIDVANYVEIQAALIRTGKFTVIDRGQGFRAVKTEQEREHRTQSDRFENREKWSHWKKLYGIGAVIVANVSCRNDRTWYFQPEGKCKEVLEIIDANTGEVITAVDGEVAVSEGEYSMAGGSVSMGYPSCDWEEIAQALAKAYPKYFEDHPLDGPLIRYQAISEESALRQNELVHRQDTMGIAEPGIERHIADQNGQAGHAASGPEKQGTDELGTAGIEE